MTYKIINWTVENHADVIEVPFASKDSALETALLWWNQFSIDQRFSRELLVIEGNGYAEQDDVVATYSYRPFADLEAENGSCRIDGKDYAFINKPSIYYVDEHSGYCTHMIRSGADAICLSDLIDSFHQMPIHFIVMKPEFRSDGYVRFGKAERVEQTNEAISV